MIGHITFHIWFKACRLIKRKYKLSTNCLLVLNGSYLLSKYISKDFTRRKLLDFVSYYDNRRIGKYMTVLMKEKFIEETYIYRSRQMYSISLRGIQIIEELNNSYNIELNKFCLLYGISL